MFRRLVLASIPFALAGCLTPVTSRLDQVNHQLAQVTTQLTETNRRLAALEVKLAEANQRLENVEKATRPQLADLVQILVEGVQAKDRTVDPASIEWTPAARPFFEPSALLWRPRTDSNRQ